jgi:hypothetical protein
MSSVVVVKGTISAAHAAFNPGQEKKGVISMAIFVGLCYDRYDMDVYAPGVFYG